MNRILVGAMALALGVTSANAQSLDDLNIQIHGYATQGFLYTTNNNILTTSSSDGSPAWTEAVLNVGAQPIPKLRIAVQARYFLLGTLGDAITLDYAAADYSVNEKFGVRFGKVKTPSSMWNETQDSDPSYLWSLLPQGVYNIESRNSELSHYGGVVYGSVNLGSKAGKLDYRGFGGERIIGTNDGYLINRREIGIIFPNGLGGVITGGSLQWRTPLKGLMIGGSDINEGTWTNPVVGNHGTLQGYQVVHQLQQYDYFARYERGRVMVAGEFNRLPVRGFTYYTGFADAPIANDYRAWYVMATYRVTNKFSGGIYQDQIINHALPFSKGPARYSKDWTVSGRYDFNQYLYAKVEQHFIDGTRDNYDPNMNLPTAALPTGLKPNAKLTIFKIGVSF
jgi:hypothetical protein